MWKRVGNVGGAASEPHTYDIFITDTDLGLILFLSVFWPRDKIFVCLCMHTYI